MFGKKDLWNKSSQEHFKSSWKHIKSNRGCVKSSLEHINSSSKHGKLSWNISSQTGHISSHAFNMWSQNGNQLDKVGLGKGRSFESYQMTSLIICWQFQLNILNFGWVICIYLFLLGDYIGYYRSWPLR